MNIWEQEKAEVLADELTLKLFPRDVVETMKNVQLIGVKKEPESGKLKHQKKILKMCDYVASRNVVEYAENYAEYLPQSEIELYPKYSIVQHFLGLLSYIIQKKDFSSVFKSAIEHVLNSNSPVSVNLDKFFEEKYEEEFGKDNPIVDICVELTKRYAVAGFMKQSGADISVYTQKLLELDKNICETMDGSRMIAVAYIYASQKEGPTWRWIQNKARTDSIMFDPSLLPYFVSQVQHYGLIDAFQKRFPDFKLSPVV